MEGPTHWAGKGHEMRWMKLVLVLAALAALSACGSQTSGTAAGTGVISLKGGDGTTGAGGKGETITTFRNSTSMVHGDLKFHTTGTVDVSFALPTTTLDFGSSPATITTDVTVETTKPA